MESFKVDSRETAYLAAFGKGFIEENLPSGDSLAREIATGAIRKSLLLDEIGKKFTQKVPRKKKEKVLFHQTLYQIFFLKNLPLYAILNESQEIAKKHIHPSFARFLNGALRNITDREIPPYKELHLRYSMPPLLIETLIGERGKEKTIEILEAFEVAPKLFARKTGGFEFIELAGTRHNLGNDLYIQNPTPAKLFEHLDAHLSLKPKRVLDMAAAPGGKLLMAADLYPDAELVGNDVNEKKLSFIRENLERLGKRAALTCSKGEDLSFDEGFDLIILDLPCSNTGVLHKRAEARWRVTKEAIEEATLKQKMLLEKGFSLLRKGGAIFYMTCSLLKEENENVAAPYQPLFQETILPTPEGLDGGFGALLIKN